MAATIGPAISFSGSLRGKYRHDATKITRALGRSGRQLIRKAPYSLEWVIEWTI
ncbi:hypothetical protein ABZS81_16590 [Streptomyces sp. NPDC005318]|uniref:hypothetical protein n=1 Tax=Streptomyces sp. NPDC005318 TaxID=3157031 RepID=UPI0033B8474B